MKYLKVLLVGIAFVIGFGYKTLNADGKSFNKGIYYDNIKYSDNVVFNKVDGTNIDYSANLSSPGDYFEIYFDVVNSTNYNVEISDYVYNEDDDYIDYELTYADGKSINNGDIIKKGESKRLMYKVYYKNPIVEDEYNIDTSFYIYYEQAI